MARSGNPQAEFEKQSAHLFALLGAPFEGQFDILNLTCQLELVVSQDSRVHHRDRLNKAVFALTGESVDPARKWQVDMGYVPETDSFGYTKVELPLRTPNSDQSIAFQLLSNGLFISLLKDKKDSDDTGQPIGPYGDRTAPHLLEPSYIDRLMIDAGLVQPMLLTGQAELQQSISEIADAAEDWSAKQRVVVHSPDAPRETLTISRSIARTMMHGRTAFDTELVAAHEKKTRDLERSRLVTVAFAGNDYTIERPTLTIEDFALSRQPSDYPSPDEYVLLSSRDEPVTTELLGTFSQDVMEQMIGRGRAA
jgi:hypothetical protein